MSPSDRVGQLVAAYDAPGSLRYRLRLRRLQSLLQMIEAVHGEAGEVRIIDIGGTPRYWSIVPQDLLDRFNVTITVVNLPGTDLPQNFGRFRFVSADGCDLAAFADQSFDIAHSNSVIEHVGDWGRMKAFAAETRRVAKHYFVQTPNYWFPVEPHCMRPFVHWLPRPVRLWLLMRFGLGRWPRVATVDAAMRAVESARLLSRGMLAALFPGATIMVERFYLMPKSYTAISGGSVAASAARESA